MNGGSWYWPDVSDLDGAKGATHYGMWCAILVASFTALFATLSIFGLRVLGTSPSAFVDAILFAGVAFGLARCSRFAAVAGFVLYLIEKIDALVVTGSVLGVGVLGVVMLFGFLNGMRGAFAYRKLVASTTSQVVPTGAAPGSI